METTRKHIFILLSALVSLTFMQNASSAQDLQSAYFIDNYTYSYRLNPAFTTKKNFIGGLLSTVSAGSNSNIGIHNLFYPHDGEIVTFMHQSVDTDYFLSRLSPINKVNVNVNYNVASTGFWTKFKGKDIFQTFEINYRNNTCANIPYNLFKFLKGGDEEGFLYDLSHVRGFTQTFIELASGTALKLDKLELGARVKFLIGTNKMSMDVKEMYANLNGDEWSISSTASFTASGGGISQRLKNGSMGEYQVIDWNGIKYRPIGFGGLGGAIDLGARYQVNDYINVSASLTDLGGILWRNKVNAFNSGYVTMLSIDDIALDDEGSIGHVLNSLIDKVESVYEFMPDKKNFTTQGLTWNANIGAEFRMPFYNKMSVGVLGTWRNSSINRYLEARVSLNATPLKWLSLSLNTAYSTFGWDIGGMINVYAKKFSAFLGTDSYYFNMTPQILPVYECNTHVVFGVNYLLTRNPFKKRPRR